MAIQQVATGVFLPAWTIRQARGSLTLVVRAEGELVEAQPATKKKGVFCPGGVGTPSSAFQRISCSFSSWLCRHSGLQSCPTAPSRDCLPFYFRTPAMYLRPQNQERGNADEGRHSGGAQQTLPSGLKAALRLKYGRFQQTPALRE